VELDTFHLQAKPIVLNVLQVSNVQQLHQHLLNVSVAITLYKVQLHVLNAQQDMNAQLRLLYLYNVLELNTLFQEQ